MTRLTDYKKTVSIVMNVWTGSGYTPDWSNDFFETALLPYDGVLDAYVVPDVDYCVDQALDWKNSTGDYACDEPNENNNVEVF